MIEYDLPQIIVKYIKSWDWDIYVGLTLLSQYIYYIFQIWEIYKHIIMSFFRYTWDIVRNYPSLCF